MTLPSHLGGHCNLTHVDHGCLKLFKDKYNCKSMIDLGCGPGGQVMEAHQMGYKPVVGFDGDFTLPRDHNIPGVIWVTHDFTTGSYPITVDYDLVWSNEFLEHIEERYIDNFMKVIDVGRIFAGTCHPPTGKKNPHHFNEQPKEYWVEVFKDYGWSYSPEMTKEAKEASTMNKPFFKNNGMVFVK